MAPNTDARVRTLDRPPHDEVGPDPVDIERCTCGVLFPRGEEHRCGHVGEWIDWERYQARQEL